MNSLAPTRASDRPCAVVARPAFLAAMTAIDQVVDHRNTIPILAHVRLSADCDHLCLSATDTDMNIRVRIPGDVDGRMETMVVAAKLLKIAKSAPKSDHLSLEMIPVGDPTPGANRFESEETNVSVDGCSYRLPALQEGEPLGQPLQMESPICLSLPGSVLWNALDGVHKAMSTEETRYYLNGVLMHFSDEAKELRFAATDGHRLYIQTVEGISAARQLSESIIPRKAVLVLMKLMKSRAGNKVVMVEVTERHVRFRFDNIELETKLVDATYPAYERVKPVNPPLKLTVEPKALLSAIDAVTVLSRKMLQIDVADGKCVLTVTTPDEGVATAEVDCTYDDDPITIGFNPAYLIDQCKQASPDGCPVTVMIGKPSEAVLITGSVHGWLGVLMPMNV